MQHSVSGCDDASLFWSCQSYNVLGRAQPVLCYATHFLVLDLLLREKVLGRFLIGVFFEQRWTSGGVEKEVLALDRKPYTLR